MNLKNADLTNPVQKGIAGLLAIGTLVLLYFLLPPLVFILKNLWLTAILGIPLAFFMYNYEILWSVFKQLSWNMTKKIISSNKLWYMWQGYHYLVRNNEALNQSVIKVGSIKHKTEKELIRLSKEANKAKEEAVYEEKRGALPVKLKVLQSKVALLTNQFNTLEPRLQSVEQQHKGLIELHDNWVADAEIVRQTLEAKEQEYELVKELSSAADSASAFLKDSPEMVAYRESLKQIDKSINEYTSNVENFQRNILPTIQRMDTQRAMNEEEGRSLIEEFKKQRLQLA